MRKWLSNIGPGTLITAAFIGPGTVTVCTLVGANFGYTLLWALLLSVTACVVLQEMAARLGVVTQKGLSEVLRSQFTNKILKWFFLMIILSAVFIGNAAYQAGNISGGVLGLETIVGSPKLIVAGIEVNYGSILIGLIAFLLLYLGNYKILERCLISLVLFMSLAFIITAIVTKPDFKEILKGFVPRIATENLFTIVGLVGTTVVPYNLFLHASLVKEKWKSNNDLPHARKDTFIAIALGGLVSISIIIAANSIRDIEVNTAADLAKSLEPVFGVLAKYVLSFGLLAAGMTSAITAPLAAGYVVSGCMGWNEGLKGKKFRAVWMFILGLGVLFSSLDFTAIQVIQFAQVANGILLPIITAFLLWIMNQKSVLKEYTNSWWQNLFGITILVITIFLGVRSIISVL